MGGPAGPCNTQDDTDWEKRSAVSSRPNGQSLLLLFQQHGGFNFQHEIRIDEGRNSNRRASWRVRILAKHLCADLAVGGEVLLDIHNKGGKLHHVVSGGANRVESCLNVVKHLLRLASKVSLSDYLSVL